MGWFGYLSKVIPNYLHLFLFGSFLQLRGISLIFCIHPSFVFPREKEIHSDTDSSWNFKSVAQGSQIQINKILSRFAPESFVSDSYSWFSEQKARSRLSGCSSFDWQSYIYISWKRLLQGLWKKVMATEMILNDLAGRLAPQVKYLNWYPEASSRYMLGMAVCDAKGKTQNPNILSSVSSHPSLI